mmetsp:Transcript_21615/g.26040  ORF Transcript_21615/g.26040 Transcript_21615/m.26040 type:complete len:235 (-) Transcript_21615:152-856(-)|eukprot:CAMPEP_0197844666 /NCGR_PEP_ID=MMETSP1438-20131217/1658_1 /TAXON_ID=1461541 /ORGANISM="Pterosperma sp., Strain CCMP1384" /LENGTH=234 /DNA_ID=CAMNT_0043455595 /DNA_START=507 /DNA_END=1211 /DNA_ORIENTATION=-
MSQFDTQDDFDIGDAGDSQAPSYDEDDQSDLRLLRKALLNEKLCPEILQYEDDLVERVKERTEEEERMMNDRPQRPEDTLVNDIHWIALDRAKYLMRAYQRTRLWKIEEHVMFILMPENGLFHRLSDHEKAYAEKYTNMLDSHCFETVLGRMPPRFTSLVMQTEPDEDQDNQEQRKFDMVPEPNLDTHVFARPRLDVGNFEIDGDTIDLQKDALYIIRYKPIRDLVLQNSVDLV